MFIQCGQNMNHCYGKQITNKKNMKKYISGQWQVILNMPKWGKKKGCKATDPEHHILRNIHIHRNSLNDISSKHV